MNTYLNRVVKPATDRLREAIGWRSSRARAVTELPPDFDEQTTRIISAVNEFTMTTPERVHAAIQAIKYVVANNIDGAIVECGVWRAGSTMAMALTLKELGDETRELYLYDTYSGMSAPTGEDVSISGKPAEKKFNARKTTDDSSQWCLSTIEEVRENVFSTGYPKDKFHFIEGKVEDTLPEKNPSSTIAVLRLDTDWYESTRHELFHLYPLLATNGVLIIDDYGHWQGARKAVDEYIADNKLCILLNRIDDTGRIAVKIQP